MIVVTVFRSILNQMDFHLVQNRMENYHHDHIPFNVKGNEILVFSVKKHARSRTANFQFLQPSSKFVYLYIAVQNNGISPQSSVPQLRTAPETPHTTT